MSTIEFFILAIAGLIAGFVNTLAGAGSLLTIPALISTGMPADIANATNRVGVFFASLTGAQGFLRAGKINQRDVFALVMPVLLGAVGGALLAVSIPENIFRPILFIMMCLVAVTLVYKPNVLIPEQGAKPLTLKEKPIAFFFLILLGAYAAFLQAGMGIFTLLVLTGMLRYDLVRANALKMFLVLVITTIALMIFISYGKIRWMTGLTVGVFQIIGAKLAVRFSLKAQEKTLRHVLIAVVVFSLFTMLINLMK